MAVKCDNCARPASYTTADPGVNPAHYCTSCLPNWLRSRADAGHFPLMEVLHKTVTQENTVDEPEVVESKPVAKRKTQPKAAEDSADESI